MTEERRLVTVLFADVTGSTELGESLDPEDLRVLLGRYYAIAKDVVGAHGGTVEKFIGDAVMAVFGLRQAHGDDAARAVAAGIELRDRVRSDPKLGTRLPIRLGINTGDVIASRDQEKDDFLVTGDAVNIAARLQQEAAPWSILAGQRTARAARGLFLFAAEQPVSVKGKSTAVTAAEVLGRARRSGARTPIFGRDADLAQLDLVAKRAFAERRPFLVSIVAPPGTGKTRLLEEFLGRLPKIDERAQVAIAQCLPYGQRLTYWPLRAVLFRIVGLSEESSPDDVREAVGAWLRDAQVEESAQIGSLLASTVGAGETERSDRAALFAAWRTFIEAAAEAAPLVLVFEDLHWSSDTLLDLFEFVLQPRGESPTLMIALARPELLDRRPAWGGGRRNHVSIALDPLDDGSIANLVRHLAEGTPRPFVDAVVKRAEGNPFFATEIVSALLDRVASFDNPAEVQVAIERLPDTVQATVLARLDLLPHAEREVIRLGSVLGRTFRPAAVAALSSDGLVSDVSAACDQLVDRDLIRPSGADGYAFRHILIREVAYGTLPRTSRATLHAAAASWLEEGARGREEIYAELVAYHYREAASLATTLELENAESIRLKAREWLERAAAVALAAAATMEAAQHLRAAIQFAASEDLPELYERLGGTAIGGGRIIEAYATALDLARKRGRGPDDELRILAKILMIQTRSQGSVANRPTLDELNALREKGRQLLQIATDPSSKAIFLVSEAFFPFWARIGGLILNEGDLAAAESSANAGIELARQLDKSNLESAALDALAWVASERADWGRAVKLSERRIEMGDRLYLRERVDAHANAAWYATLAGDLATADLLSAAGLALVQPRQVPDWALHLGAWRVLVLLLAGRWDEAEAAAERAYSFWVEAGRLAAGYATRGFTAALIIAHARKDDERITRWTAAIDEIDVQFESSALREFQRALIEWDIQRLGAALDRQRENPPILAVAPEALGMYLSVCSDARRLIDEAFLELALTNARNRRTPILEGELERALGLALSDVDRLERAKALFAESGAQPQVARTQCETAILRGDRQELEAGLAYLESIRDEEQVERYLRESSAFR